MKLDTSLSPRPLLPGHPQPTRRGSSRAPTSPAEAPSAQEARYRKRRSSENRQVTSLNSPSLLLFHLTRIAAPRPTTITTSSLASHHAFSSITSHRSHHPSFCQPIHHRHLTLGSSLPSSAPPTHTQPAHSREDVLRLHNTDLHILHAFFQHAQAPFACM